MRSTVSPILALAALAAGCSSEQPQPAVGPVAGHWIRIDSDGVLDPATWRSYLADGTYALSDGSSGTWTYSEEPVAWSTSVRHVPGDLSTQPQILELALDADLMIMGSPDAVLRNDPATVQPLPDSTWTASVSGCCANGSPFNEQISLQLRADQTCTYERSTSAMGPPSTRFECTWIATLLGFELLPEQGGTIDFLHVANAVGDGGYQRSDPP